MDLVIFFSIKTDDSSLIESYPHDAVFELAGYNEKRDKTLIYYLHGSFFIINDLATEKIYKYINKDSGNGYINENVIKYLRRKENLLKNQLVVTEGNSSKKLEIIKNNQYLNFCLDKLANFDNIPNDNDDDEIKQEAEHKMCIIGFSGSDEDNHIINALANNKNTEFTICVNGYTNESLLDLETDFKNLFATLRKNEKKDKLNFKIYNVTSNDYIFNEDTQLKLSCDSSLKKIQQDEWLKFQNIMQQRSI